jgi:monofunctional biosynthetic peptidoglycan transglycosylase
VSTLPKKTKVSKHKQDKPTSLRKMLGNLVFHALMFFMVSSVGSCLLLRWLPVPTSAFMLYRHYEDLVNGHSYKSIDYRWVAAHNMSPSAAAAVLSSEDQQFFHHAGFDVPSIEASINVYLNGGRLRGASTISQQVAKNLFLTPSKSFVRKGLEVWFTVLIEWLWSKGRILEVYLNIAEFGDHIFGVEAASQRYFGIPAKQLSKQQAALLAATLPNPIRFQALHPTSYVLKRQHWILRQIQNMGYNTHNILK